VWIGAGSEETNALARELGATLNLWGAAPGQVAEAAARGPVSWAGPLGAYPAARLGELAEAGAAWAVAAPDAWMEDLANWRRANPLTKFH
jgi:hypothetical protein